MEELAFVRQIACRPLDCENVKPPKQTPPLSSFCEGDDCVQILLSFACGAGSTRGRQFDVRERRDTCFAAPLFPHRASRCFVPSTTPSSPRRLSTFCIGGMSSAAGAPRHEACGPVLPTICRALRCSTHTSFHGLAESPGRQGASSFALLFVRLWLH